MKISPFAACVFVSVWLGACGQPPAPPKVAVDTAKIVDAIKTDEVHWNADYKSGDPAKLARHYAPNAVLMLPGTAPAVGAVAIEAALKPAIEDPGFTLTFASEKIDVAASGDLAASRGTYRETSTDPKTKAIMTDAGSYLTVYKPDARGVWKAVWDINTQGPPVSIGAAMAGATTAKSPQ